MDQRVLLIRFREFKELTHYHLTLVVERKKPFFFLPTGEGGKFRKLVFEPPEVSKNFWGCLFIKRQGLWFWQVEEIPLVSAIAENGFSLAEPFHYDMNKIGRAHV